MSDKNTASIQSLLRYSLPLGACVVAGDPETQVNWAVTIRAQPPVFPEHLRWRIGYCIHGRLAQF